MIWSGLPYSDDLISKVYEEGAVVDMSDISFPTIKTVYDNMKAAIIYLRNTGYKVQLDFSKMSFEQKSALLKAYLDSKVKYDIPELDDTWIKIFYACAHFDINLENAILNELELNCFIATEREYLLKWANFIISLPIYLVLRLDVKMDTDNLETSDEELNVVNFLNVIKHQDFDSLMIMSGGKAPTNYTKIFTLENNELFETLARKEFNSILIGMVSGEPDKFLDFLKEITIEEE